MWDGAKLEVAQEPQTVSEDVAKALSHLLPGGFRSVIGPLRQHNTVVFNLFIDQPLRVGNGLAKRAYRLRRGKPRDNVRVPAFQVSEIVEMAVGQHDEPAIQGTRVPAFPALCRRAVSMAMVKVPKLAPGPP